jgi:hypothetical protein
MSTATRFPTNSASAGLTAHQEENHGDANI